MPKPWRLTRAAEASLIDIAAWTVETFGPRQAAAYEENPIAVCREIAAGVALSQDCRRLIDPDLPENLRFARAGEHFIIFTEDAGQAIVLDFLHGRPDPAATARQYARREARQEAMSRLSSIAPNPARRAGRPLRRIRSGSRPEFLVARLSARRFPDAATGGTCCLRRSGV